MPKHKVKPSQKDMLSAYKAAKEGQMSIREAAKKFKIPKSTLIDKVNGKSPLDCKKGPKPILSADEEECLADWGVKMAGIGYTCIRTQIMYTVKTILDKDEKEGRGREKRFGENNLPGKDWWVRFCDRHPKLKKANAQVKARSKKLATSDAAISKWKSSFNRFLKRNNIKDSSCLFTCTTSRFLVDGHRGMVKYCSSKKILEGAKYLTVLTASSANGKFIPPMMVYPGDHTDVDLLEDEAIEGTYFTKSRNGNLNVELFYSWLGNHFLDYTPAGKTIVLLLEGNWSFVDMYVSRLCKDRQIILYSMPPSSNFFQEPMSWGFSKLLPNEWKKESMNFELLNPGMKVDRYTFPAVFSNVWSHLASENNMRSAFESPGIWPLGSRNKHKTPNEPNHMDVSCYDEEGNEIEVAMYEEVISEHSAVSLQDDAENVTSRSSAPESPPNKSNLLKQFEEVQSLSEEQKELFETRFLLNFAGQHDLVYNAWKALKELAVIKQDTSVDYDEHSDVDGEGYADDDDDDDSLLGWLSDESESNNEKENINDEQSDKEDSCSVSRSDDYDPDGDDESGDNEGNQEHGDEERGDLRLSSASSTESSEEFPSKVSVSRTTMSPLKISRYVHPGTAVEKRQKLKKRPRSQKSNKKKGRGKRR